MEKTSVTTVTQREPSGPGETNRDDSDKSRPSCGAGCEADCVVSSLSGPEREKVRRVNGEVSTVSHTRVTSD